VVEREPSHPTPVLWKLARSRACSGSIECFALPMTLIQIGETFGLTAFHVNRMLQKMRRERLIRYQRGTVKVPDWCRLAALAEFDAEHITDRWRAALRALDEATDYPVEAECAWLNGPRSALRHDEHRARSSSIDDDAKGIFAMGLFTRDIEARRRRPPSRGDRYVGPA